MQMARHRGGFMIRPLGTRERRVSPARWRSEPSRSSASARSRGCSACPLQRSAPGRRATATSSRSGRGGGQRLYSRDQVDQLRFVKDEVDAGRRPGEAHRLLAERVKRGDSFGGTRLRVLVAESRVGASTLLAELLGTEAFEVLLASDPAAAGRAFDELAPGGRGDRRRRHVISRSSRSESGPPG